MASNPLLEAMRGGRKAKSLYDEDSLYQDSENGPGLLSRVGQGALSGVSAVGNFLDIPGSMTRDLLGGSNPFDQLLSPFSDTNRLTGRDLLRKHGMVGSEDTYGNWWGGFGVELLTDPTMLMGVGEFTQGGKAAAKAGLMGVESLGTRTLRQTLKTTLPDVLTRIGKLGGDDAIKFGEALSHAATKTAGSKEAGLKLLSNSDQGLQSLFSLGVPFMDSTKMHFGTGKWAQEFAGGLGVIDEALKATAPVRGIRALFDSSVSMNGKTFFGREEQKVAEEAFKLEKARNTAIKLSSMQYVQAGEEAFKAFKEEFGPEMAAKSEQGHGRLKQMLMNRGNLKDPEATAIADIWKAHAEGYQGTDLDTFLNKSLKDIVYGPIPTGPNVLHQGYAPEFYSKLERTIEQKVGGKTTWDQLKATLKNNGVKDEEIADVGLEGFMQGKKSVSKQDILGHFQANRPQFQEVNLGEPKPWGTPEEISRFEELDNLAHHDANFGGEHGDQSWTRELDDELQLLLDKKTNAYHASKLPPAKFEGFKVPGGKNYREMLLTVPGLKGGGPHFAEDTLAHARMDDVRLPDGRKILRIQEIQSDLHQAGRKHGYAGDVQAAPPRIEVAGFAAEDSIVTDLMKLQAGELSGVEFISRTGLDGPAIDDLIDKVQSGHWSLEQGAVALGISTDAVERVAGGAASWSITRPQKAAFGNSWHELMLKKILRKAAEEGYDGVGIVNGADIAAAVGGPASELGAFYDDILANSAKKLTKQSPELVQLFGRKEGRSTADVLEELGTGAIDQQQAINQLPEHGPAGWGSIEGKTYSGETKVFSLTPELKNKLLTEGQPLYQAGDAGAKAAVAFEKDGKAIIHAFTNTDVSSHLHEFAHIARRHMGNDDMQILNKWVGATDGVWGKDHEEKFARGFENYIRTGKAPSTFIGQVFDKLKQWMTSIYQTISGSQIDVKVPSEIKAVYDKMLGGQAYHGSAGYGDAAVRSLFEGVVRMTAELPGQDPAEAVAYLSPGSKPPSGQLADKLKPFIKLAQQQAKGVFDEAKRLGGNIDALKMLPDSAGAETSPFWHRKFDVKSKINDPLNMATEGAGHREGPRRYVPAAVLNDMQLDPATRGAEGADYILKNKKWNKYIGGEGYDKYTDASGKIVSRTPAEAKIHHAVALAKDLADKQVAQGYLNTAGTDHGAYMTGMNTLVKHYKAIRQVVMQEMVPGGEVSIPRMYKDAGMDVEQSLNALSDITGKSVQELSEHGVSEATAKAINGSYKATSDPVWATKISEYADKFNQWFKQNVTILFPAHHAKNHTSGQFMNMASGDMEQLSDIPLYGKKFLEALQMGHGGMTSEMMQEFAAHDVFNSNMGSEGVALAGTAAVPTGGNKIGVGSIVHAADRGNFGKVLEVGNTHSTVHWRSPEGVDAVKKVPNEILTPASQLQNPANVPATWSQAGSQITNDPLKQSIMDGLLGKTASELLGKVPGVGVARQVHQTLLGTGAKASQWVEWMNRVPMYLYLKEKGYSPAAAAARVAELQIDYSLGTPFEKGVMRRLFPFYSWNRRIAPVLLTTLWQRPGGALAQTIRLENRAHGEDALTPDHVASTLAIPNPWKNPEEGQSYITGFGLPFEQTAQFFGNFPSLREAGREALSQTTPLIKAPLEWASGQSFFQSGSGGAGRPLEELDPTLSRTISNVTGAKLDTPDLLEFAVSNSPLSRIASTARTATDTRKTAGEKALNLLTGVRVTDVSPAAEDAVLRERAKDVMRDLGAKTFEKVYFSKEDLAQMDPKQRAEAEKFQALMALLATKAKERKKLAGARK